jgi:phosphoribosylaminoimidazole-succinocarboxamide synthase
VTALAELPLLASGKVREMYDLGDRLLMVASDRISTYDVVHPNGIPDKGKVLTGLSAFWFAKTGHIVPNHFVSATDGVPDEVRGRAIVARKLDMLPVECVVRGYITGSGWKDYQAREGLGHRARARPAGVRAPAAADLHPVDQGRRRPRRGDRLRQAAELVGDRDLMTRLRDASIALYEFANEHARTRGVILADTKFEFGLGPGDGELVLGDEVLTPDSSRFWPADDYAPGRGQKSFDKQYVRDWAPAPGWDKQPPAPEIPEDIAPARARSTSRPTSSSPASRSTPG